ncbi:MobA/MobL family protein, partial [Escherichia coli]|uniref:MobA/MobL family protein n=1 Tax=Escherichia coli TaxID=562 RepID=UPI001F5BD4FC
SWCADRSVLWNAVEKAEQRRDSQLAREIELAIPREISRDAARRAAEALNLTIPAANASADTLREFIATLPQECGNAWEMT